MTLEELKQRTDISYLEVKDVDGLRCVYDIASVPDGIDADRVFEIWNEHKVLFWDSTKGKNPIFLEVK